MTALERLRAAGYDPLVVDAIAEAAASTAPDAATVADLEAIVLPLAKTIGELRRRVGALEAAGAAAKIPQETTTRTKGNS